MRRVGLTVAAAVFASTATLTTGGAAQAAGSPVIVTPDDSTEEVPGGWTGPAEVDFSSAAPGSYTVFLGCDGKYSSVTVEHTVPDDGPTLSWTFPALPADTACSMLVTPTDDDQNWLDLATFATGDKTLELSDLDAPQSFYPRVLDGYADKLRMTYWITQVAQIKGTIRRSDGTVVRVLSRSQGYSGEGSLTWDGRNADGHVVRAGRYAMRIVATNWRGEQSAASRAFYLADLLSVAPGRIGPARAGMTKSEAMATGAFRSNVTYTVPGVCSKVYPLLPRDPYRWTYLPFLRKGVIDEVTAVRLRQVRLPRSLPWNATARQVRRAYDGNVTAGTAGYSNNTLFARDGRRWIAFVFRSYSYNSRLEPTDKVSFVSVARGHKPQGLTDDGC